MKRPAKHFLILLGCIIAYRYPQVLAEEAIQACSGRLLQEEDGLLLEPDPDQTSSWCSAYVGETVSSPEAVTVLKSCKVGQRCRIKGAFAGHGIFYWTRIDAAEHLGP